MPSALSIENQLISILGEEDQWRYRPDIKTEDDLWANLLSQWLRVAKTVLRKFYWNMI